MNLIQATSVVSAALLLNACASNSAKYEIPEKGTSSIALQVTRSAGSGTIIEDQTLPKGAISDVGIGGYVGSTAMGLAFGSMTTGFGLAILANQKYGWDRRNLVMYLDADTYSGLDGYEMCKVVLSKMNEVMIPSFDTLQSFTNKPISRDSKFYDERYNGGESLCVEGYPLDSNVDSHAAIYFRGVDTAFLGTRVGVRSISEPFSTDLFDADLKKQIPDTNVIAVRFTYYSSLIAHMQYSDFETTGLVNANGLSTSPYIKLPTATFMSLPMKEYIADSKYIPLTNAVRNNDEVYFFVKPERGVQATMSLEGYHTKVSAIVDREKNQS
ncbi:hypothetical protein F0251_23280 [Vibrio sp. 070316B]|uniref:hypothetical protein n=1 Tax=Vibrio sp. 070316B TaxID=2607608 RepID=UPI0014938FC2|nr:hypothetical protein [Vibrio sp. 070316B]NOI41334.1 hypothetical protein [Vibrio sp. 070316B]